MSKHRNQTLTASGRHLHKVASDMLYRASKGSPNRAWHNPRTGTLACSDLPRNHPKFRPASGLGKFQDGPREARDYEPKRPRAQRDTGADREAAIKAVRARKALCRACASKYRVGPR